MLVSCTVSFRNYMAVDWIIAPYSLVCFLASVSWIFLYLIIFYIPEYLNSLPISHSSVINFISQASWFCFKRKRKKERKEKKKKERTKKKKLVFSWNQLQQLLHKGITKQTMTSQATEKERKENTVRCLKDSSKIMRDLERAWLSTPIQ